MLLHRQIRLVRIYTALVGREAVNSRIRVKNREGHWLGAIRLSQLAAK
jgi:hypothetical protein